MKICSTLIVTGQVQIKTTVRYHSVLSRMTIKKRDNNSAVNKIKKLETSYSANGNVKHNAFKNIFSKDYTWGLAIYCNFYVPIGQRYRSVLYLIVT